MAETPIKLTLSEDTDVSEPTVLITAGATVHVNVMGVRQEAGPELARMLIDIGEGLLRALSGEGVQRSPEEFRDPAHEIHRDAENAVPSKAPRFAPKPA